VKYLTVGGNLISPVFKFRHFTISKVFRAEGEQNESSGRYDRLAHCWMDNSSRTRREYPCHKVDRSGQQEIVNFERDRPSLGDEEELAPKLGGSGIACRPAL